MQTNRMIEHERMMVEYRKSLSPAARERIARELSELHKKHTKPQAHQKKKTTAEDHQRWLRERTKRKVLAGLEMDRILKDGKRKPTIGKTDSDTKDAADEAIANAIFEMTSGHPSVNGGAESNLQGRISSQPSPLDDDEPDDQPASTDEDDDIVDEILRASEKDEADGDQGEDEDERLAASIFSAAGGEKRDITRVLEGVPGTGAR